jgi:hypothetical protein
VSLSAPIARRAWLLLAGAHLAALVGTDDRLLARHGLEPGKLGGIVLLDAVSAATAGSKGNHSPTGCETRVVRRRRSTNPTRPI